MVVEWNAETHQPIIDEVKKEWLHSGLYGEVDEAKARESWKSLYEFCGFDKPLVFVLDSPLAVQLAASIFSGLTGEEGAQLRLQLNLQLRSQLSSQLRSQLHSQLSPQLDSQLSSQLSPQLDSQLNSQLRSQLDSQLSSQLWSQLNSQLWSQLSSQLDLQLRSQLRSQLDLQLRSQLESQLRSQLVHKFYSLSYEGVYLSSSWVSFYDAASKILNKEVKGQKLYNNHLKEGGVCAVALKGFVFTSRKPITHWNEENKLHATNGAAVIFPDGYSLYSVFGVRFDKEDFDRYITQKPTPTELMQLDNTEQRAAILEHHGWDLLLEKATVIDEYKTEQRGYTGKQTHYKLYKSPDKRIPVNLLYGEWWEAGEKRSFVETMPENLKTCKDTVAWSFGFDNPDDYWDNLVLES